MCLDVVYRMLVATALAVLGCPIVPCRAIAQAPPGTGGVGSADSWRLERSPLQPGGEQRGVHLVLAPLPDDPSPGYSRPFCLSAGVAGGLGIALLTVAGGGGSPGRSWSLPPGGLLLVGGGGGALFGGLMCPPEHEPARYSSPCFLLTLAAGAVVAAQWGRTRGSADEYGLGASFTAKIGAVSGGLLAYPVAATVCRRR